MKQERKASENNLQKSLRSARMRRVLFAALGFLATALPLCWLLVLRWDRYTAIPGGGVRLCFGGILIAALLLWKVVGKIKLPSRLTVAVAALVLVYLLEGILVDLTLILWAATLGEAVDTLIFAPLSGREKKKIERLQTAKTTAGAVEELLKTYMGGNERGKQQ